MQEMDQTPQGIASLGNSSFLSQALGNVSPQEEQRDVQILHNYFEQNQVPQDQALKILQAAVQSGVKFKRNDHTVMGYKQIPPSSAQVYFFSDDEPEGMVKSIQYFIGMLKQSGVNAVYMNKADPMVVQALQMAGAEPQQSDMPQYKIKAMI